MVQMTKGPNQKQVHESRVQHNILNGWSVCDTVQAVLRRPVNNTEVAPAVEETASEQGLHDEANLKENHNE